MEDKIARYAALRGMSVQSLFRAACAWAHRRPLHALADADYHTYIWSGVVPHYVIGYMRRTGDE